jgi:hypothetical protein
MKLCQHVTQRRAPPPAPLLLRYVASDRGGHTTGDFIDMIHARHQTDCHPLTAPAAGIERATQMRICEYIRNDRAFPECDRSGVLEWFGEPCSFLLPFRVSKFLAFLRDFVSWLSGLSTGTLPRRCEDTNDAQGRFVGERLDHGRVFSATRTSSGGRANSTFSTTLPTVSTRGKPMEFR